jgi:hypothetical protein
MSYGNVEQEAYGRQVMAVGPRPQHGQAEGWADQSWAGTLAFAYGGPVGASDGGNKSETNIIQIKF